MTVNGSSGGQFVLIPTGNMGSQVIDRPLINTSHAGNTHGESADNPQQSKPLFFTIGKQGAAFTQGQTNALQDAFRTINSDNCRKWINSILNEKFEYFDQTAAKGTPPPANLDELISRFPISRYLPELTAQQMGISPAAKKDLDDHYGFWSYFLGVHNNGRIWLTNEAFESRNDLPGIIMHEFFHAIGYDELFIPNNEIQKHCGRGGIIGD